MIKLFVSFIILASFGTFAQDGKSFVDRYVETEGKKAQTEEVDKILDDYFLSPGSNDCYKDSSRSAAEIASCFESVFNDQKNVSEEKLIEISKQLGLKERNLVASESRKAIADFLTDRLRKMLGGKSSQTGANQEVDVAQRDLIDLHRKQLEKNSIQELITFCRHNFDFTNNEFKSSSASSSSETSNQIQTLTQDDSKDINDTSSSIKTDIDNLRSNPNSISQCFRLIGRSCDRGNSPDTYHADACSMRSRIRHYEELLAKSKANADWARSHQSGAKFQELGIQTFDRNQNPDVFDEITTITSGDLENLDKDYLSKIREENSKLIEKCKRNQNSPACEQIISQDEKDHLERERLKFIAQTALDLKKIDGLEQVEVEHEDESHQQTLQRFVDTYLTEDEKKNFNPGDQQAVQQIKDQIKQKYALERAALLSQLDKQIEESKAATPDKLSKEMKDRLNKLKNDQLFNNLARQEIEVCVTEAGQTADQQNQCPGERQKLDAKDYKFEFDGLKKYAPQFAKEEEERRQQNPERSVANQKKGNDEGNFDENFLDALLGTQR